jgi:hypothetical protein
VSALATIAAALATGLILGCVLTASFAAAARSRSQQRMQTKVLYWQVKYADEREAADQLARRLEALDPSPRPPT